MRSARTDPRFALAVLGVAALACHASGQNIRRARPLDPGEVRPVRDGLSWSTAYVNLQDAIDFRATQPVFSQTWEIWVSGKHIPPTSTRTQTGVIRTETFRKLRQNTRILGGFAGTETSANQRNPSQNPTTLSGDIGNDGDPSNNTFTLITIGAIDSSVPGTADNTLVFDGLILQDGVANTTGRYSGPCVNIFSGYSATFVNCTFQNNTAGSPGATNGQGAAVMLQNNGSPVFTGCTFSNNTSNGEGGAVWISGAPLGATFNACNFESNRARVGGAIHLIGNPVAINGGRFSGNIAALAGGAIARFQGGGLTVSDCEFTLNAAGVIPSGVIVGPGDFAEGGALTLQSTEAAQATDRFTNCKFNFNTVTAQGAPWGAAANRGAAAIHHINGVLIISRSEFIENYLPNAANALGAAIRAYSSASNNYLLGSRIRIDRTKFHDNTTPGGRGGAVNTYRGQLDVYSSVFFRNSARGDGTAIFYEDPPVISGNTRASILLANSLFHANTCTRTGPNCSVATNGAVAAQGDSRIINCSFANNTATQTAGVMLYQIGGSVVPNPTVANCILTGNINLAPLPQGRPYAANFNTDAANISGFQSVVNNCIGGGFPLGNNIAVDPRFFDTDGADNFPGSADDNYRLALNSPCLDAGDSTRLPQDAPDLDADTNTTEAIPLDLDLMPRRQDVPDAPDVGFGGAPVPDMGCYEAVPAVSVSFWNNPSGGAFSTPSNWTPIGTPPSNGSAIFDLNAAYTVSFTADVTIDSFEVRTDAVDFNLSGRTLNAAGLTTSVARRTDDHGSLTLRDGTTRLGTLRLADAARTIASLSLEPGSGAGSSFTCNSSLVVGALGSASMTISPGCSVSSLIATIGEQPGSFGTVGLLGPNASMSASLLTQVQRGSIALRNGATLAPGLLGALLLQDGSLSGQGTVTGTVFNFGTVAPGNVAAAAESERTTTATLNFTNGYQQVGTLGATPDSGTLQVELGPSSNDRLDVTGPALLAGGLFVVAQTGFNPANDYSATVLTADSIGQPAQGGAANAAFDVALFPALSNGRFFVVEYGQAIGSSRREVRVAVRTLAQDVITGDTTDVNAPGRPTDIALGRFNDDGFPDLVLAIPDPDPAIQGAVTLLRNNGSAPDGAWGGFTFDAQSTFPSGGAGPVDLAIGDFNADGLDDVIVVNKSADNYRVMLNTTVGSGPVVFTPFGTFSTAQKPAGVVVTDFNADGKPDAVIAVQGGGNVGQVVPLINLGASGPSFNGFQALSGLNVGPGPTALAAARFAGSTFSDRPGLIVANSGVPEGSGNTVSILYNAGPNSPAPYSNAVSVPVGDGPRRIVLDLESDKDTDSFFAAVINDPNQGVAPAGQASEAGSISMLRFLPGQSTSPSVTFDAGAGLSPRGAATLDLDFDGDTDLAVVVSGTEANATAAVRVFRNDTPPGNGPLVFAPRSDDLTANQAFTLLASADVNNDGDDDLVIVNEDTVTARGERAGPGVQIVPVLCLGDFNDDGLVSSPDLVFFLGRFGQAATPGSPAARADFNANQIVDTPDLVAFIGRFGATCN